MSPAGLRDRAAIAGIGHTGCFKQADVAGPVLWLRACREAVADAGLRLADVDGIACVNTDPVADAVKPTPYFFVEALGLPDVRWHGGPLGGGFAVGALGAAATAIATGQCRHVLAIHTMSRPVRSQGIPHNYLGADVAAGLQAFLAPYGFGVFIQYIAAWYQRLRSVYGIRREQIGRMVVDQRVSASLNPRAVMRAPITLDDYLAARWLAEPLCLLDADMPVAGAVAYLVTSAQRARDLRQPPVYVAHAASWLGPRGDFVFHHDYTQMFPARRAQEFWSAAGFGPGDMDFAQLHDGFSVYVPYWLEAMGFVDWRDMGDFIGGGGLARDGGRLPTNTHGGNLSEGRFQGGGHVIEAVLQIRGQAGPRQLARAAAGLVTAGGAPSLGAAVLHR
ncbi:MAG: acetyl-CoA acetyltransferase [Gammaproteobacteria bacterium]